MKNYLRLILTMFCCLFFPYTHSQQISSKPPEQITNQDSIIGRDRANWKTPFRFDTPKSWNRDTFKLHAPSVPTLSVDGWVDVRMPQNWRSPQSENHWSYAFLWWLPGSPTIHKEQLEKDLNLYYDDIVELNVKRRKIPTDSVVLTQTILNKLKSFTFNHDQGNLIKTVTIKMEESGQDNPKNKCYKNDHNLIRLPFHQTTESIRC